MTVGHAFFGRLVPLVITMGAATLLVFVGANNLEVIRSGQEGQGQGGAARGYQKAQPVTPQGKLDIAKIPGWHLFGKQPIRAKAAPAPKPESIEAPATRLKLTLQGTFLGDKTTEEGWAIISTPNKEQKLYRVGDEIPGGATLYAVEAHQVILTRNGRHESLTLPRPKVGEEAPSTDRPLSRIPGLPEPVVDRLNRSPEVQKDQRALIQEMNRIRKNFSRAPK